MLKVLHVATQLGNGGIDRVLFNYSNHMPEDIQFDFAICSEEGSLEQEILKLGCKIFRIPKMRDGLKKYSEVLGRIILLGQYDIVHVHAAYKSAPALRVALKCGVKVRIAHTHTSFAPETATSRCIRSAFTILTKRYATDLFACGDDAANWTWGSQSIKDGGVFVMRNAIDVDSFLYNPNSRERIRNELGLNNRFVIGNVARFDALKNQRFLVEVFSEIANTRDDASLLLVGAGEQFDDIKRQVHEMNLDSRVLFYGEANNVNDLLSAMDVFVLPSVTEGLPVVIVEVQANGLPAVVSTAVTKELIDTRLTTTLSLDEGVSRWARVVAEERARVLTAGDNNPYDVSVAAGVLAEKYRHLVTIRERSIGSFDA